MNKFLHKMIEDTAKSNDTGAEQAFKSYIALKARQVLREFTADSAIRLVGDDVMIHGKKVGTVPMDLNKWETQNITFVSNDGVIRQEFDDDENGTAPEQLYAFLAKTYNVKE